MKQAKPAPSLRRRSRRLVPLAGRARQRRTLSAVQAHRLQLPVPEGVLPLRGTVMEANEIMN